jgi:hypothetical protein
LQHQYGLKNIEHKKLCISINDKDKKPLFQCTTNFPTIFIGLKNIQLAGPLWLVAGRGLEQRRDRHHNDRHQGDQGRPHRSLALRSQKRPSEDLHDPFAIVKKMSGDDEKKHNSEPLVHLLPAMRGYAEKRRGMLDLLKDNKASEGQKRKTGETRHIDRKTYGRGA